MVSKTVELLASQQILNREVNVYGTYENPLFLAKDVAEWIDYAKTSKGSYNVAMMLQSIDDDEKLVRTIFVSGQNREVWMLTESGLYEVLMMSRKPIAKQFKKKIKTLMKVIRKQVVALESVKYRGCVDGIVFSKDGTPTTTSRIIASVFERNHKDVLEGIDNKLKSHNATIADFTAANIKEIMYLSINGQMYREYELTEDGFSFIALGFTEERADEYKIKYISAFNEMRRAIVNMFKVKVLEDVLPQESKLRQYLYVIKNPLSEAVKIGVAKDVDLRLKQLQTGAGTKLELVYKSMLCSNAFKIEKAAHNYFINYQCFGEWFRVPPAEIISYIERQEFILNSNFNKHSALRS